MRSLIDGSRIARVIYDITPPIRTSMAVWPGDSPPSREILLEISKGDTVTLSTLRATVHLGAHADAPSHYGLDAPTIESRSLSYYIGTCQVIHAKVAKNELVGLKNFSTKIQAERLLIRTGTFLDWDSFHEDFAAIEPDLVNYCSRIGIRLIGIDTPSVDPFLSKDLQAHQAFLHHDMAILEGLDLRHINEGVYELIALPLPLVGFDASPVRAILRTLEGHDVKSR